MKLTLQSFLSNIKENSLIKTGDKVIVAFSGGKDSVVLLYLLKEISDIIGFSLEALHINHNIRGSEAKRDEEFAKKFSEKINVPFKSVSVNVPLYAKENKKGLEESARILRYKALFDESEKSGFNKIAVAHSLSDQAETVLFHLIRGCGIAGLSGMADKNERIIRPLIPFSTSEIISFANSEKLSYIYDSTNSDTKLSRNYIRSILIPKMNELNPNTEDSIYKLSKISGMTKDYLLYQVKENFGENFDFIEIDKISQLLKHKENTVLIYHALQCMCDKKDISLDFERFNKVLSLINNKSTDKIIEIEKGFSFRIKKNFLVLEKPNTADYIFSDKIPLKSGNNIIDCISAELNITKLQEKISKNNKKLLKIALSSCKIKGDLFLHFPTKKDTVTMYSMRKNIYQFFKDAKIPIELRKFIPVVSDEEEIIWIPFFGLCDKVRENNNNSLQFELKGNIFDEIRKYI